MNNEWHERFAANTGNVLDAQVDAAGNIGFGSEIVPGDMSIGSAEHYSMPLLVELSRLTVIDIGGDGATDFLQDQVCNDVTTLNTDQVQINGYCSPKGRLLALFTVFANQDGYRLVLADGVAPAFLKRLQMLKGLPIFEPGAKVAASREVTVTPRTDLVCTGLVLDAASPLDGIEWPAGFPETPAASLGLTGNDHVQVVRWHDDPGHSAGDASDSSMAAGGAKSVRARYICIGSADSLFPLWQDEQFSHAAWPYWRSGDINAGIPNVFPESTDQFIPQMLNMHLIDAMSFEKGCYPGQEIVARMQYLGKLKKHMKHLYQTGASDAPQPGTTLTTESNNNAGQVVDAVADERGLNLLAVVNIDTPVSDLLLDGQGVQDAQVPYSLLPDSDDEPGSDSPKGA